MSSVTRRRRVCFVLPSLNGGGAERAAVQVLNGLDAATWDRSMFLFERTGPYLHDVDTGVTLESSPHPSRVSRWRSLRSFVRQARPDVVMAFLSFGSALTAARAASTGAKVVFNQQTPVSAFLTDADYQWRRGWRRAAFTTGSRFVYGAADLIVATSRGVADDLTRNFGVSPDLMRVLPNPVDLGVVRARAAEPIASSEQLRTGDPVVVAAGRLADAKNYPLLIDAIAKLRASLPARLFILGQGELEPELRRQVADRGLTGAVTFLGFQSNPWKFIAQADVFALSSHYEGFGNVLIEAMALGVPVVATASAGTRDIVESESTGLLVNSHTVDGFATALGRVLDNRELRDAMSRAARHAAERFAAPRVIAEYDALLRELAAFSPAEP
jgi:glycosyltransferase involved in cell wall biosynthesis